MSTVLLVAAGVALGAVLGLVHFGGLAYTVARLPDARRRTALLLGSLAVRATVLAAGLVGAAILDPLMLVAAVGGLLGARTVLIRRAGGRPPAVRPDQRGREG